MNGAKSSNSGDAALNARAKGFRLLDALTASSCDHIAKRPENSYWDTADDVLGEAISLCELWWTGDVPEDMASVSLATSKNTSKIAQDLSPYYPMMLSFETFAKYHHHVETGSIDVVSAKVTCLCYPSRIGPSSCGSQSSSLNKT